MTRQRDERLELIEALGGLQKTHQEIVDKYTVSIKERLHELIDGLRGRAPTDGRSTLSRSKAKEMLEELKDVKLKPEKGRGKDLYRIEKLVVELEDSYRGR